MKVNWTIEPNPNGFDELKMQGTDWGRPLEIIYRAGDYLLVRRNGRSYRHLFVESNRREMFCGKKSFDMPNGIVLAFDAPSLSTDKTVTFAPFCKTCVKIYTAKYKK